MNQSDILLLGLKNKVAAISKSDGREIWRTELRGGRFGSSGNFITMICDDLYVFAYASGHLHCLDLSSGRLLWTSDLPGYGYGLASLCVPGCGSAPDLAVIKHLMAQQDASSVGASTAVVAAS